MRKQPSFNQIQEQKIDINIIKNLMQRLIVELKSDALKYPENKDAIEWFCKEMSDFFMLYICAQNPNDNTISSIQSLEHKWQQLKEHYQRMGAKNSIVIDGWKQLSSITSRFF